MCLGTGRIRDPPLLLQSAGDGLPTTISESSQEPRSSRLARELACVVRGVREDVRRGSTVEQSLAANACLRPLYLDSWRQWLSSNQSIVALRPLLMRNQLQDAVGHGLRLSYLYALIYFLLASLSLGIVLGIALPRVRDLMDQVGQPPPWGTTMLFKIADGLWWWLSGLGILALAAGVLMIRSQRQVATTSRRAPAARWLDLASQAGGSAPASPEGSAARASPTLSLPAPLLDWARQAGATPGDRPANQLAARLYLWISHTSTARAAVRWPMLVNLLLGGGLALLAGVLLFYPMVEMLLVVVNNSGDRP